MQILNFPNKMVDFTTETKLKITQEIHGFVPGQEVLYNHQTPQTQLLLRRRIADGDGSVEIVKTVTEVPKAVTSKSKSEPPKPGSKGTGKQTKGDE